MTTEIALLGVMFPLLCIFIYAASFWYGWYRGDKNGYNAAWTLVNERVRDLKDEYSSHVHSLSNEIEFLRDALLDDDLVLTKMRDEEEVDDNE